MKATWKKIWYPDGSTLELVDGKPEPEFKCVMIPPRTVDLFEDLDKLQQALDSRFKEP